MKGIIYLFSFISAYKSSSLTHVHYKCGVSFYFWYLKSVCDAFSFIWVYYTWGVLFNCCFYKCIWWVTQKLPQICTVILRIRIGKVAWFAVYICGNFWVTQYIACECQVWVWWFAGRNIRMMVVQRLVEVIALR